MGLSTKKIVDVDTGMNVEELMDLLQTPSKYKSMYKDLVDKQKQVEAAQAKLQEDSRVFELNVADQRRVTAHREAEFSKKMEDLQLREARYTETQEKTNAALKDAFAEALANKNAAMELMRDAEKNQQAAWAEIDVARKSADVALSKAERKLKNLERREMGVAENEQRLTESWKELGDKQVKLKALFS
jgi:hypothetical protein